MTESQLAYISFDIVPAPKGAAIHIAAFSQALAAAFGDVELVTVSPTTETVDLYEIYPQVMHIMLPAVGDTLIHRILYFRSLLRTWLQKQRFAAVHIRSIYEGYGIALNKKQYCDRLIFEVNGLPSIELKYRYPAVADDRELLHKLHSQEQICLQAADLIVTPSSVTVEYLQNRGIEPEKIRVIPNGVDLNVFTYCLTQNLQPFKMLYFGTLSPWQGVNLAIEALELVNRDLPAFLTVIGQGRDYQIKALKQLALKLGVADKLTILEAMPQKQLVEYIHTSNVILAPLTPNDRNLVQGCCPLKILEAMATGTPVIASDLPVVRELGIDGVHFLLVKSGSAKAIKDAVLRLRNDRELAMQLAINARKRIEEYYTWKAAGEALIAVYQELGIKRLITA
ncbi:MAG: glycosyltransferase family 4 protein [Spirirestis rafaelensis WJT71-NPBG6]|jgi:glycosyltransferase involved in cell wall biosynthesis|nr:glycosyltransferase family 4 protein [Spirirestis rafaelensis WJT71-NPBG6]